MLKKLDAEIFGWFIVTWALYTETKIVDCIGREIRFGVNNEQRLFWSIAIVIGILFFGSRLIFFKLKNVEPESVIHLLDREILFGKFFRRLLQIFSTAIMCLWIIFCCRYAFDNCLLPVAIFLDHYGAYESAEQVFRYREDRIDRRVPFAAWKSYSSDLEDYETRIRRNQAVARVFGSNSLEMANRLYFCAVNLSSKTGDDSDAMIASYGKAFELYKSNNCANGQVACLREMTLAKFDRKQKKECIDYANEAVHLAPMCKQTKRYVGLGIIGYMAGQLGRNDIKVALETRETELSKTFSSNKIDEAVSAVYWSLLFGLAISFASGFGVPIFRRFMLLERYQFLQEKFNNSQEQEAKFDLLTRMMDIDLFLGNLKLAAYNCSNLFMLAGEDSSNELIDDLKQKPLWTKALVMDQLAAFGIVLLFVYSLHF